jgi:hypothetical protein
VQVRVFLHFHKGGLKSVIAIGSACQEIPTVV